MQTYIPTTRLILLILLHYYSTSGTWYDDIVQFTVLVSARVPAIVLPPRVVENIDAGNSSDGDFVSIYAVANDDITYSLALDFDTFGERSDECQSSGRYLPLANTSQSQNQGQSAVQPANPWLTLLSAEFDTKKPGTGIGTSIRLRLDATTFLATAAVMRLKPITKVRRRRRRRQKRNSETETENEMIIQPQPWLLLSVDF